MFLEDNIFCPISFHILKLVNFYSIDALQDCQEGSPAELRDQLQNCEHRCEQLNEQCVKNEQKYDELHSQYELSANNVNQSEERYTNYEYIYN